MSRLNEDVKDHENVRSVLRLLFQKWHGPAIRSEGPRAMSVTMEAPAREAVV
jgi:hypothetical protein